MAYTYPYPQDKFIPNHRALFGSDVRRVFSGKDAMVYDGDGVLISSCDTFQAKVNIATTNYQPLGSPISQAFITGYTCTLALTNCVIEDEKFFQDVAAFFMKGRHAPMLTVQSVIYGYNGSESHFVFRDCVPTDDLDLHNFSIGDIIKRTFSLRCNVAPELIRKLTYM